METKVLEKTEELTVAIEIVECCKLPQKKYSLKREKLLILN